MRILNGRGDYVQDEKVPVWLKYCFLFFVGGAAYFYLEILYRGFSHISMFLCGGLAFVLIGSINQVIKRPISILAQMVIGAVIITALEFIFGIAVNLWLNLNVWDYSGMPYNILGQICLAYSNLWFLLSFVCILLDDFIRIRLFGEKPPKYYFV